MENPGLAPALVSFVAGHKGQRIILKSGLAPHKVPAREVLIVERMKKHANILTAGLCLAVTSSGSRPMGNRSPKRWRSLKRNNSNGRPPCSRRSLPLLRTVGQALVLLRGELLLQ
jgi:hypothetical protein